MQNTTAETLQAATRWAKAYVGRTYVNASLETVLEASEDARVNDDLLVALALDDLAEDMGASSDDRSTCYSCQTWANHSHGDLFDMTSKIYFWPMVDRDLPGSPLIITEGVRV